MKEMIQKFTNYFNVWQELHLEIIVKWIEAGKQAPGSNAMRFPLICHAPIFVIGMPEAEQHAAAVNQAAALPDPDLLTNYVLSLELNCLLLCTRLLSTPKKIHQIED